MSIIFMSYTVHCIYVAETMLLVPFMACSAVNDSGSQYFAKVDTNIHSNTYALTFQEIMEMINL